MCYNLFRLQDGRLEIEAGNQKLFVVARLVGGCLQLQDLTELRQGRPPERDYVLVQRRRRRHAHERRPQL